MKQNKLNKGKKMKQLTKALCAVPVGALLLASQAMAAEPTLQEVLNSITVGPVLGVSSVVVGVPPGVGAGDYIPEGKDAHWAIGGSGGSIATFVIEITAGAATHKLGIYDVVNPSKKVELFGGGAVPGSQVVVSIKADGSVFLNVVTDTGIDFAGNKFGFYYDALAGDGSALWYSNTSLNTDGFDHMLAFQGKGDTIKIDGLAPGIWGANEYIFGWEDAPGGGDKDYQDLVVLVESINPLPDSGATMVLLGMGLVGMGMLRRRMTA